MQTKRRLKLIFTGYTGIPQYHFDGHEDYTYDVDPVTGKLLCQWADKPTTYTLSVDENLVKDIFVPNEDGKISPENYEKLYDIANGLIADSIFSMNGIIPCFKSPTFTSYFADFLQGGDTHLTTVEAVWEVVNVTPIESL